MRERQHEYKKNAAEPDVASVTSVFAERLSSRSMWERDYAAHCHYLFSLKQCGINMIIQSKAAIDSVQRGDVSGKKNNAFDIFIKLHVVSGRHNWELLRDHKVVFEGPNAEGGEQRHREELRPCTLTFAGMHSNHKQLTVFTPAGGRPAGERAAETIGAPPQWRPMAAGVIRS